MPAQNGNANTASTDGTNPDVAQLWRAWLTETERQLNGFFGDVLGTEEFARISGNFVDGYAVVQHSLNQQMERYLNTFNLPTHSDIIELAERLNAIEERISSMETTLRNVANQVGVAASAQPTPIRPRRTRRPK
ncbi:MAG: poly(R)-hydroxyalkanoic acid synthase subunit PhaE [Chloroflexota bacterium]